MAKKSATMGKGKGKKDESGWFGPTVLGVAVIVVVVLMAMRMCSGPSKEEEAAEEAAKPAPTLVAYPDPDEVFPRRRLRFASPDEAEQLFVERCEWFLRWQTEEPPARVEVLVFVMRQAAENAWARETGEEIAGEAGEFEKVDAASKRIALRRGKLVGRVIGGEGSDLESLQELARELDAAMVRTWGAHPK